MVQALVKARMRRGVTKTKARLELAMALDTTDQSVRNWEFGRTAPHHLYAKAITRLYEEEVGNG